MNDLVVVADTVERVLIDKDSSGLDKDDTRWRLDSHALAALTETGDRHTDGLEELIASIHRGESPRPRPPGGTRTPGGDER